MIALALLLEKKHLAVVISYRTRTKTYTMKSGEIFEVVFKPVNVENIFSSCKF